jgi:hypothetical protein
VSEYIDKNEAVGEGYLADWYIHSVAEYDDEKLNEPRWTEKHIEELTQDFIVIPKDTPAADVAPVVHAHWKGYHTQDPYCSNCGFSYDREEGEYAQTTDYCGNCGAKMDENEVENLKRCSCGDRHYCPEVEKDENGKWFIRCHMCRKIVRGNTIEEAVNAWNRRADTNEH